MYLHSQHITQNNFNINSNVVIHSYNRIYIASSLTLATTHSIYIASQVAYSGFGRISVLTRAKCTFYYKKKSIVATFVKNKFKHFGQDLRCIVISELKLLLKIYTFISYFIFFPKKSDRTPNSLGFFKIATCPNTPPRQLV